MSLCQIFTYTAYIIRYHTVCSGHKVYRATTTNALCHHHLTCAAVPDRAEGYTLEEAEMAPGGNFFARVMQYIANEIVVKSLANSPGFQRFAVRSQAQIQNFSKNAVDTARALSDNPTMNEAVKVGPMLS